MHDEQGNAIETPQEMFLRVAEHMAKGELLFEGGQDLYETTKDFYLMMVAMEFLPGSRILYEAGNPHMGQLASCFVLPLEDDMNSIFQTLQDAAVVHQHNGGVGYNFSKIRPKGDVVKGVPHVAAGPLHYLETFSVALSQVMQGSKRPGGNMGVLNVTHPDIMDFITFKNEDGKFANFNISVGVTDSFMESVRRDEEYDLVNPRTGQADKKLRARQVFDTIINHAWATGDPGMIFLDRVQDGNPTPEIGAMDATNPCGEQPLLPYESCNLGSVVLVNHVTERGEVDWEKLRQTMHKGVRFMDNMLEVNNYPLEAIEQMVRYGNRKIGIGIFGFAQMLYKMGIPYNSEAAIKLAEEIMRFLNDEGHKASGKLAEERGVFPNWEKSIYAKDGKKMRNATVTTIAPTGTLSMVPATSSGVEPVFSLVIVRNTFFEDYGNRKPGATLIFADQIFEKTAREKGFWSEELMKHIADVGTLQDIKEIPENVKRVFVTAHDVEPEWHVRIQAAFQKHTDNAVSKTINFPHTATPDDVRKAYIMAYETGCKGITIYRDGSKQHQILNVSKKKETGSESTKVFDGTSSAATFAPAVLTANALTVLEKRALLKDAEGNVVEKPNELFRRTANFIASAESQYGKSDNEVSEYAEKFYRMLAGLAFVPGQALRNSTDTRLTLSACLVLPIEDSIDSIMRALKENVIAHQSTIGTGFNFSRLRSRNAQVGSTGEIASGPVEFLKAINAAQGTIRTKGGRQQGAMAILNVDHPDIEEFIEVKDQAGVVDHFNISVGVTNAFMEAVRNDGDWDLVDPHSKEVTKTLRARDLFRKIAHHAWVSGDPGVIFLDPVERDNPTPTLGRMDATNPCGEQPLLPYDTCNLGSIVVSRMLKKLPNGQMDMDWDAFRETIHLAVRFLDNTIDLNRFPLDAIKDMTLGNRRIGLGVMGFADMLIMLGIPYDSEQAVTWAEKVMAFMKKESHNASENLAHEKGSFPNHKVSIWQGVREMRNCSVTTIAPTGYTSIVAGCSSGIEPHYALAFKRANSMGGHDQFEVNALFEEVAKCEGFWSESLMEDVSEKGIASKVSGIPDAWKKIFVTAQEIAPSAHVRIQAAFQKYTDNAVSKTINFANSASVEEIEKVYQMAYETGCKGVTVFRDGSKEIQVMHVGTKSPQAKVESATEIVEQPMTTVVTSQVIVPRERPEVVKGQTYKVKTSYGNLFVTINDDESGKPFEIFAQIGKSGGVYAAKSEAICRLASLALRSGVDVSEVIKQLKGIRGPMPSWGKHGMILSIPDAIAQILEGHLQRDQQKLNLEFDKKGARVEPKSETVANATDAKEPVYEEIKTAEEALERESEEHQDVLEETTESATAFEEVKVTVSEVIAEPVKEKVLSTRSVADIGYAADCPECGSVLEFGEGCMVCRSCGYSKCG